MGSHGPHAGRLPRPPRRRGPAHRRHHRPGRRRGPPRRAGGGHQRRRRATWTTRSWPRASPWPSTAEREPWPRPRRWAWPASCSWASATPAWTVPARRPARSASPPGRPGGGRRPAGRGAARRGRRRAHLLRPQRRLRAPRPRPGAPGGPARRRARGHPRLLEATVHREAIRAGLELVSGLGLDLPPEWSPDLHRRLVHRRRRHHPPIDVSAHLEAKRASMGAHGSQATGGTRTVGLLAGCPRPFPPWLRHRVVRRGRSSRLPARTTTCSPACPTPPDPTGWAPSRLAAFHPRLRPRAPGRRRTAPEPRRGAGRLSRPVLS